MSSWNEDRIATAKKRWLEGRSASEIANEIGGGLSRNAVIGKIHRLGLAGRQPASRPTNVRFGQRPLSAPAVKRAPNTGNGHSFSKGQTLKARAADVANARPGAVIGSVSITTPETAEKRRQARLAESLAAIEAVEAANDTAILLVNRGRFQCSFPVGEPARPSEQMCCGRPVVSDPNRAVPTYCHGHGLKAMTKAALTAPRDAKTYERSLRRFVA
ncbi:GcrA family cell cycle regulator [Brevundimonas sp. FT23028]|uniref:GcrA family cell cycle regulator n=1 Tax=Brevundimonas sp. FT23028 TaxID=3393748 RepID=UPI003B589F79